jgi:hypothetical protein
MENLAYEVFENVTELKFLYSEILLKDENSSLKAIFQNRIAQDIKDKINQKSNNRETNVALIIYSEFYAGAILSVISWWIKNDMSISIRDISRYLHELLSAKHSYSERFN